MTKNSSLTKPHSLPLPATKGRGKKNKKEKGQANSETKGSEAHKRKRIWSIAQLLANKYPRQNSQNRGLGDGKEGITLTPQHSTHQ